MGEQEKHFIAILGLAKQEAKYSKDKSLDLDIKEGEYFNSTDALFSNFENAEFTLIGTQEAIKEQKLIFESKCSKCNCMALEYLEEAKIIDKNNIEEIFGIILETISKSKQQTIILDITHGLRHQPLIAAFAAMLSKINSDKTIKILFAQEEEQYKKYRYIYLDSYVDIGINAILLKGFIETLSVPKSWSNSDSLIKALQDFTNSLHANDFKTLFDNLDKALSEASNKKELCNGLEELIGKVENILEKFEEIKDIKEDYKKYYYISEIMYDKGYYLIAVTYAFEALRKFMVEEFQEKGFIKKGNFSDYQIAQFVQNFVLKVNEPKEILKPDDAKKFIESQQELIAIWKNLKNIRNDIAHINNNSNHNIKEELEKFYKVKENLKI